MWVEMFLYLSKRAFFFLLTILHRSTHEHRPKWTTKTVEEALEKARPSEGEIRGPAHYLEEIHVSALANVLKRPIMILAEGFQGGLFLPFRHDPEVSKLKNDTEDISQTS